MLSLLHWGMLVSLFHSSNVLNGILNSSIYKILLPVFSGRRIYPSVNFGNYYGLRYRIGHTRNAAMLRRREARGPARERDDLASARLRPDLPDALPVCKSFHTALPPKMSPAPVVSTTLISFRLSTWPPAFRFWNQQPSAPHVTNTSFAGIVAQNVLRALPRAEAEQELDLFVADLHHVGLPEAPEHLLLRLVEAAFHSGLRRFGS